MVKTGARPWHSSVFDNCRKKHGRLLMATSVDEMFRAEDAGWRWAKGCWNPCAVWVIDADILHYSSLLLLIGETVRCLVLTYGRKTCAIPVYLVIVAGLSPVYLLEAPLSLPQHAVHRPRRYFKMHNPFCVGEMLPNRIEMVVLFETR